MGRKTDTHAAPELLLRRFLFVRSIEKFYLKESSIMVFGLLKDIKNGEYRTIATPNEIASIAADGHTVLV